MVYYKLARPDGFDFYTGHTINYRDSIGQIVKPPNANPSANLCSSGVLHASLKAEHCFQGGSIPCSLYEIEGIPVCSDATKAGFVEMRVLREIDPASHFKWRYAQAANPLKPLALPVRNVPSAHDLVLLRQWASVRDSVWASLGASLWDSAWASAWASVRDSVENSLRDSLWASVWASLWASLGVSAWDSEGNSVRDSVGVSVWAYAGWVFDPVVTDWKYVNHRKGQYPFIALVRLWQRGLVPSYDGTTWRLHSGDKAAVVYAAEGRKA